MDVQRLLTITTVGLALAICFSTTAYAESATFKQQILPLNCVFEEVNDGLGTLLYLTPAECGQIITPLAINDRDTSNDYTTPLPSGKTATVRRYSLVNLAPSSSGPKPVSTLVPPIVTTSGPLINSSSEATKPQGYSLLVKEGEVLYYQPLGKPAASLRKITISHIKRNQADIDIQPLGLQKTIKLHESLRLDTDQTSTPAIEITLEHIDLGPDPDVTLRLKLLAELKRPNQHRPDNANNGLLAVVSLVLFAAAVVSLTYWHTDKRSNRH
jgi:hypothetical protein